MNVERRCTVQPIDEFESKSHHKRRHFPYAEIVFFCTFQITSSLHPALSLSRTTIMDALHLELNRSGSSTPSSFGSPLSTTLASFPPHPPYHLGRASSFSGESSHQWSPSLTQLSSYGQPDSYPGSPLIPSGSSVQSYERFRPTSSLSHNLDRQLEELKTRCDQLTNRNTALEAEVVTIK